MLNEDEIKALRKYEKYRKLKDYLDELSKHFTSVNKKLKKVKGVANEINMDGFKKGAEMIRDDFQHESCNFYFMCVEEDNSDIFYDVKDVLQTNWFIKELDEENKKVVFCDGKISLPLSVDDWSYISSNIMKGNTFGDDVWHEFIEYLVEEELDEKQKTLEGKNESG